MTNEIILSNRLKNIMDFLPAGSFFADIGSDHAYLPIAVCQHDQSAKAIAGELNEGPYRSALEHVTTQRLTDQIKVIKGDGLEVIQFEPVKQVVIAGMGGGLICSILEQGKHLLKDVDRLILQPNVNSEYIREWLLNTDYQLVAERILAEEGHIYEILVADIAVTKARYEYSDKEILFGPYLIKEKNNVFKQKWQRERKNYRRIIEQMLRAKEPDLIKINQFKLKEKWIEEVLKDD
ncbi:tRNA (adenine(22)-N(1))-methyltransferase [Amphibacillus sp. Q70]|uniref:tRNA (adenine(22)-N(1))-methyltransferase n=1 Tax=Amphibacillus sp. Q70 TaxID=3453416 RepID=UPI003F8442CE